MLNCAIEIRLESFILSFYAQVLWHNIRFKKLKMYKMQTILYEVKTELSSSMIVWLNLWFIPHQTNLNKSNANLTSVVFFVVQRLKYRNVRPRPSILERAFVNSILQTPLISWYAEWYERFASIWDSEGLKGLSFILFI